MKLKNAVLAIATILMMAFGAQTCESKLTSAERSQLSNKVEIVDVWGGHARRASRLSAGSAWRNVTLVIANPTNTNRKVKASCSFKDDGTLFGERVVVARAGYKMKTVVRGFPRLEGMGNTLSCGLKPAK